jgi:hypothetical protein
VDDWGRDFVESVRRGNEEGQRKRAEHDELVAALRRKAEALCPGYVATFEDRCCSSCRRNFTVKKAGPRPRKCLRCLKAETGMPECLWCHETTVARPHQEACWWCYREFLQPHFCSSCLRDYWGREHTCPPKIW